jgi:hypothetical protein
MDLIGIGSILEGVGKIAGDLITTDKERIELELEGRKKLPVPGHNPAMTYEFGLIWSVAYKVADSESGEELVIASDQSFVRKHQLAQKSEPTRTAVETIP